MLCNLSLYVRHFVHFTDTPGELEMTGKFGLLYIVQCCSARYCTHTDGIFRKICNASSNFNYTKARNEYNT